MHVPYSYLGRQFANPEPIFDQMREIISQGDFTLGKRVDEFEEKFASFLNVKHAIGVGSGTDSLFLSLKAIGIGDSPKDEVITTANTFVATAGAIHTAGAKIVFVDCNDQYVMDVDQVESAITENTKAIMPVHYSGQPVDMDKLMSLAEKYNLPVIEDACCAIDAKWKGKNCGTIGLSGGFSFHPLKNLNIWSDGGMIVTNSDEMNNKLRLLRNHGMSDRDNYDFYAYNSRLDTLQTAVANYLLPDVTWITDKRIEFAETFDKAFSDIKEITIPKRDPEVRRVYHMYMLLIENKNMRDELNAYLQENKIESKIHYPIPLHLQKASSHLGYKEGDFPVAEDQAKRIISLPVHQHLSDKEVSFVINKVRTFFNK